MKYAVVIEKSNEGYWVYVPDLPGCTSFGETRELAERNIGEAIESHIESLREHGEPVPPSTTSVALVDAAA